MNEEESSEPFAQARKNNKHKRFGRDGVQDKLGPVPGTNRPFSV